MGISDEDVDLPVSLSELYEMESAAARKFFEETLLTMIELRLLCKDLRAVLPGFRSLLERGGIPPVR